MDASKKMHEYFASIEEGVAKAYEYAEKARKKGFDPEEKVDIPLAKGIAQRVEGLISAAVPNILKSGVAERILELEKEYGSLDWRVALKIAEEVAKEKFIKFDEKKLALETGVRVGLAYITLGVISAPLEGFIELKIKKRRDGKEYVSAFFAGPIRAAGGTAEAVSLLITDYVRMKTGYEKYDPEEKEIKRTLTEIRDYHDRVTNLQYFPSDREIEFLMKHLPIEVNGDPTEEMEVSNYKDLDRIETNRIRGGICLVLAEGLAQKAPKVNKQLKKWGKSFGLEWEFMTDFLNLQKEIKAKGAVKKDTAVKITPNYTFIKDLVAGRPVLSYPMAKGGLRLRYGRTRTTGLAAAALHPATMDILNEYIAIGTQLKIERPGKAAAIVSCDTIDGPIIKLKNGNVKKLDKEKINNDDIEEILYIGDMLFNYGDFSENGHRLVPAGYCPEWWIKDFEKSSVAFFGSIDVEKISELLSVDYEHMQHVFDDPITTKVSARLAYKISRIFEIPLHPEYVYYWDSISLDEFISLQKWISTAKVENDDAKVTKIILNKSVEKRALEKIGFEHILVGNEFVVIEKEHADNIHRIFLRGKELIKKEKIEDMLFELTGVIHRDKSGTFIGARMGRPEKAKMRKLTGSPHFLFPVGDEGGRLKSVQAALEAKKITADFPVFFCEKCDNETIFTKCTECGSKTVERFYCNKCGIRKDKCPHDFVFNHRKKEIDINTMFRKALTDAKITVFPDLIKGVRETSNKNHVTEHILKGVLRAKHGIFVNKDGTTRYDMIELPITHFKPSEVGTSIEKLIEMGYDKDIHNRPLEDRDQVLELKPQDVILPATRDLVDEPADEVLFRVANFLDDLLVTLYKMPPYYNLNQKRNLLEN